MIEVKKTKGDGLFFQKLFVFHDISRGSIHSSLQQQQYVVVNTADSFLCYCSKHFDFCSILVNGFLSPADAMKKTKKRQKETDCFFRSCLYFMTYLEARFIVVYSSSSMQQSTPQILFCATVANILISVLYQLSSQHWFLFLFFVFVFIS